MKKISLLSYRLKYIFEYNLLQGNMTVGEHIIKNGKFAAFTIYCTKTKNMRFLGQLI